LHYVVDSLSGRFTTSGSGYICNRMLSKRKRVAHGRRRYCLALDSLSFFRHWLSDPLRIGAVAPSSRTLAALITAEIAPEIAPVIELGPGSGAFTRALLDRGVPERRLALIEQNPVFAFTLRKQFPVARVLCVDAAALGSIDVFSGEGAGAVVSGLPLLLMPPDKVGAILESAFARLRPDGAFYQFTYASRSPVPRPILDRLGLTATRIGATLVNIPPATVYRIAHRRAESRVLQMKPQLEEPKRVAHAAVPSLMNAISPVSIKERFHGIGNFFKQQQRAIFRAESPTRR
jgi:phosphatidylethanolamine/phosphatidyl-N-methylethanolamine N-methyltransferase